ncbi:site-specific integrase [Yanshouia hominis]|uniref:Site-specific integrase n=1 Tax=Yanshouia hominis TaxID=2763673 RepID=A0ABR7NFK2_9FIRM|nr:site-specific integrase [Yanshouia hominis]MBC8575193.1 site-specific integrase [Yanshouia hominis]
MSVYKNADSGTWYAMCWFTDWKGKRKQKCKRGFATKKEAQAWEREFLMQKQSDVTMSFESFVSLYEKDVKPKLKLNTWLTKESIIQKKILPYFKKRKLSEITAKDVIDWQNEIRSLTDSKGKPYSTTYLKTVHNQLSALFNHAIKYYGLQSNPAAKAGNMGSEERKEMLFWTKAEYLKFADAMMDKPISYYAFEMLYWCGIREGELLALSASDFDFTNSTVTISKSYQRLKGQDVITTPKTKKSNRVIKMPQFLCEEMQDYIKMFYSAEDDERIFPISKHYLHSEMDRGCKETGVKRIRIHDLRHSHISLLIDMGFTALAIADRVGHESIDITYRYAHLFPTRQTEMAEKLNFERIEEGA